MFTSTVIYLRVLLPFRCYLMIVEMKAECRCVQLKLESNIVVCSLKIGNAKRSPSPLFMNAMMTCSFLCLLCSIESNY